MSSSASVSIGFGIAFDEGKAPWELEDEYESNIDIWWMIKSGFKYCPETAGKEDKWNKKHPNPFDSMYCGDSGSNNMVLILKQTRQNLDWFGELDISKLNQDIDVLSDIFIKLCKENGIEYDGDPKWLVACSYL